MPEAIKRPKVSDILVERLRHEIVSGVIGVGERLPSERDLMARFGVGRSAVREALFSLQKSGHVQIRNGERALATVPSSTFVLSEFAAVVRPMVASDPGMRNFQEVRILLEGALARRAAQVATDVEIEKIRAELHENQTAGDDPERLHRSDIAFHLSIAAVGDNPFFTMMHDATNIWLAEQRRTSVVIPQAARLATRWHEKIFECIARRDPDGAMAAMEGHLRMVRDFYWQVRELERVHIEQQERELSDLSPAHPPGGAEK